MNDDILKQIVLNPDNVLKVIDEMNDIFFYSYLRHMTKNTKERTDLSFEHIQRCTHNAYSYYKNGHCFSYSKILCNVFGDYAEKYNSHDHVIVKIGDKFYDVDGLISDTVPKGFHKTDIDDLYEIDISFGLKDDLEIPIEKDLIEAGKQKLQLLISTNTKTLTKK